MMLTGKSRIKSITLSLGILFSSSVFAFETISINPDTTRTYPISSSFQISGAYNATFNTFFTVNDQNPIIYQTTVDLSGTGKKTTQILYKNLSELTGYYPYARSIAGNKKFSLEGITYCPSATGGIDFYLVNGETGDILKVYQGNLVKVDVTYEKFANYRYEQGKDGFMGVAANCSAKKLYVAKLKNPNIVFEIDFSKKETAEVTEAFNMSTGSDVEDDISDLFFANGRLNVLQKNINSIAVVNPLYPKGQYIEKRYDYSSISEFTTANNNNEDEVGIAEALVVRDNSILLFLDQRKINKSNADISKDVIVELKI